MLVPVATVLERIGLIARARARKRAFDALAAGLASADRERLDALLVNGPEVRRSRFAWLRDYPESPASLNMLELLDRLNYVRDLGIGADRARRIHPVRLSRLVDEGAIMSAQHITNLEPSRRTAILVAQVTELETKLADATLAMFEKYMGSLFTKARSKDERRFSATKRDVAKALLLFRQTIFALKQAKATGEEGVSAIEREIGMARLERALPVIESVAHVAEQDPWLPRPRSTPCSAGSRRASWTRSGSSPARRTIPCWLLSSCSGQRARAGSPSGRQQLSCRRDGAS